MSSTLTQLCIPTSQQILQLRFHGDVSDDDNDDDADDIGHKQLVMLMMVSMVVMMMTVMTMARKQRPLLGLIFTGQHCPGPPEALKPASSTAQLRISTAV